MSLQTLLSSLGPECDPEEEPFLLFSQSIPSQSLGFVDSKATTLDITIRDRDLTIYQSPTILSSSRDGGTTGAVVWKITPLFASWFDASENIFSKHGVLSQESAILELGCGISGIIALSTAPLTKNYTLTDQEYVMRYLTKNLAENHVNSKGKVSSKNRNSSLNSKSRKASATPLSTHASSNISVKLLDWETDEVASALAGCGHEDGSFDIVIACDCIYNDALIAPLVQTCVDACSLRQPKPNTESQGQPQPGPSVCIVAQQLRSAEVFESWLEAFHEYFRVWRLPDEVLGKELGSGSGFVVHIGVLRSQTSEL